ncbi:MAG: DUF1028 domain-containing protein [Bacteroidetes bacterium]|nr:DUF1028 domain-containing protein [Bacteroidota bacterium]
MKILYSLILFFVPYFALAQHTFSIVAIDTVTKEIGSAGATCLSGIKNPPGAKMISDIIPGRGAIHTQAWYRETNQLIARSRMLAGDSPQQIIVWLLDHDEQLTPEKRQYGIVDLDSTGSPRAAGFTGELCDSFKNHISERNYSIQGNILLGQQILDSMKSRFLATQGTLADKLMAALQGAKVIGADTRCFQYNTSTLSAFIRVAKWNNREDSLYLDLNVPALPYGYDPIDSLQILYDEFISTGIDEYDIIEQNSEYTLQINSEKILVVQSSESIKGKIVVIYNILGNIVWQGEMNSNTLQVDLSLFSKGIHFVKVGNTIGKFVII